MNRIVIKPDVCNGRPVIRGTRITAQTILEFLAAGDSVAEVLKGYSLRKFTTDEMDILTLMEK
jgi:uncharacterized protein (DUF433 family)